MNKKEAQALLRMIQTGDRRKKAKVYQIANGDYVVIVKSVWLWSLEDWETLRPMNT